MLDLPNTSKRVYDTYMSSPAAACIDSVDVELELAEVAGVLNAQHARLVRLTASAIASGGWFGCGIHTPAQWLTIQVGLSRGRARQVVAVAEKADSFPMLMAAFDRGELGFDQVFICATRAPAWADAMVTRFASAATVPQLVRMIRDEHFDGDPHEPVPDDAEPSRESCSIVWDEHSKLRISATLEADRGAIFESAIGEARDSLFQAGKTDVTWADALVEIARRSLDGTSSERQDRFKTYIHIGTDKGVTQFTNGVVLPDAIRDYLLCDAHIQPVWERDNIPFGVGLATRTVPDRMRQIIGHRDQGCRVPGCGNKRVDLHHVIHWVDGGPTETWNMASICPADHRKHHQGLLRISGNADSPGGLLFADQHGRPLVQHPTPTPPTGSPAQPDGKYEHPSGERLRPRWIDWAHPNALKQRRAESDQHHQRQTEQLELERKDWVVPTPTVPKPVNFTSLRRDPYTRALAAAHGDPTKVPDNWAEVYRQ